MWWISIPFPSRLVGKDLQKLSLILIYTSFKLRLIKSFRLESFSFSLVLLSRNWSMAWEVERGLRHSNSQCMFHRVYRTRMNTISFFFFLLFLIITSLPVPDEKVEGKKRLSSCFVICIWTEMSWLIGKRLKVKRHYWSLFFLSLYFVQSIVSSVSIVLFFLSSCVFPVVQSRSLQVHIRIDIDTYCTHIALK